MPGKASPNGGFQAGGCLKNQNSRLFLQTAANAVLKSLGIRKGFLRFLPCIRLLFAKNPAIPVFFKQAPKTIKRG